MDTSLAVYTASDAPSGRVTGGITARDASKWTHHWRHIPPDLQQSWLDTRIKLGIAAESASYGKYAEEKQQIGFHLEEKRGRVAAE